MMESLMKKLLGCSRGEEIADRASRGGQIFIFLENLF